METTAVVIADDHPLVRKAVKDTIKRVENLKFIGEANDGLELLSLLKKVVPDIAIIDLEMPVLNGYDTICELHTLYPALKIIAFSGFLNAENQQRAINAGAYASISKTEVNKNFIKALDAVIKGEHYHSQVSNNFYAQPVKDDRHSELTLREKQILSLIAEGKTSRQISGVYNISQWTVDKHRSNIRGKLGLTNLSEMVRYAIERGYLN